MHRWPTRLTSLLLFVLFAGGVGLPVVDGLVFHGVEEHERQVHVEAADGPACHTADCAIHWLPGSGSLAAHGLDVRDVAEVLREARALRPELAPTLPAPHPRQPRAPPHA